MRDINNLSFTRGLDIIRSQLIYLRRRVNLNRKMSPIMTMMLRRFHLRFLLYLGSIPTCHLRLLNPERLPLHHKTEKTRTHLWQIRRKIPTLEEGEIIVRTNLRRKLMLQNLHTTLIVAKFTMKQLENGLNSSKFKPLMNQLLPFLLDVFV